MDLEVETNTDLNPEEQKIYDELSGDVNVALDGREMEFDPSTVLERAKETEDPEAAANLFYNAMHQLCQDSYSLAEALQDDELDGKHYKKPLRNVELSVVGLTNYGAEIGGPREFPRATLVAMKGSDRDYGEFEETLSELTM